MGSNELIGNTLTTVMSISLTTAVVVGFAFVLLVFAMHQNKGRSIALLLSIPLAGIMYQAVAVTPIYQSVILSQPNAILVSFGAFVVSLFYIFWTLQKFIHGKFSSVQKTKIIQIGLFIILAEGVLFSVLYTLFYIYALHTFSSFFNVLFNNPYSLLSWLFLMLVGLYIIRSHR